MVISAVAIMIGMMVRMYRIMDTRKPFAGLIPAVIFVFAFGPMAIAFYVGAVPGARMTKQQ